MSLNKEHYEEKFKKMSLGLIIYKCVCLLVVLLGIFVMAAIKWKQLKERLHFGLKRKNLWIGNQ